MSGLELLQEIKQKFENPSPVVMMMTAYGDEDNYNQAKKFGADDFLTKPVDFKVLKENQKTGDCFSNLKGFHNEAVDLQLPLLPYNFYCLCLM